MGPGVGGGGGEGGGEGGRAGVTLFRGNPDQFCRDEGALFIFHASHNFLGLHSFSFVFVAGSMFILLVLSREPGEFP